MTDDLLAALHAIAPDVLAGVARRSLDLPEFQLADWSVSPLAHEKVIETTGGLYLFRGQGWDDNATGGDKPGRGEMMTWSAVLKIIRRPDGECEEPGGLCYWRRELLAYQSGLLAALPPVLRAPRCYGVSERADGGWIWLEMIQEQGGAVWDLADFEYAARQLGRFSGAYLVDRPLPNFPWLCASLWRGFYADGDWWAKFINPHTPNNAWQRPLVQAVYPARLRARVLQLWAEKRQLIAANERLPRVFCHNDAHRRNLMRRESAAGQPGLVAIDWGFCGPGGLGNDLGELVGTSLSYFAFDPAQAAELETAVLDGYQAGLRDVGWGGDARLARLGYLLALGLYWGGTLPCEVAIAQPEEARVNAEAKYGRPVAALLPGWTLLAEFALERADEARYWIERLL